MPNISLFCCRSSPNAASLCTSKIVKGATIGVYILGIGALMGALYFGVHGLHPSMTYPLAFKATLIGGSSALLLAVALTVYSCTIKSPPIKHENPQTYESFLKKTEKEIDETPTEEYRNMLFTLSSKVEEKEGEVPEEILDFLPQLVNRTANAVDDPKGCVKLADHLDQIHPVLFVEIWKVLSFGQRQIVTTKLAQNEQVKYCMIEMVNWGNIFALKARHQPLMLDHKWSEFTLKNTVE
ncbi:MAG: hypothetical protein K940chlam9_00811 [Chlamydiae bacterium]|nr:hypothetical protein [Chlamydiota bacterium]